MQKIFASVLFGAWLAASLGVALATVGSPPLPSNGPGLVDGSWLNGLAGGQNVIYQNGLTAVGSTQATALQLGAGIKQFEIDTSGAGGATGIALPTCIAGTELNIFNNTAYSIILYPSIANNQLLSPAAQDTIASAAQVGTTSFTMTTYTRKGLTCAKTGNWFAG